MRIGPLAEFILIFLRLVFQRHLFLWCQICLLCHGKMLKAERGEEIFDILSSCEFVGFVGYGNEVEAFVKNRFFSV